MERFVLIFERQVCIVRYEVSGCPIQKFACRHFFVVLQFVESDDASRSLLLLMRMVVLRLVEYAMAVQQGFGL